MESGMKLKLTREEQGWCCQACDYLKLWSEDQARSEYRQLNVTLARELLRCPPDEHPHCRSGSRLVVMAASNFVNANFICAAALCGSQPDSAVDFWEMVVQFKIKAVVKFTQDCGVEYFPLRQGASQVYGRIKVTNRQCSRSVHEVTTRVLEVECPGFASFTLKHFQYSWPDFGVPRRLEAVQEIFAALYNICGYYFVHCRAGIGRAGTFIAIDYILRSILNGHKTCKISDAVAFLRQQRRGLVETEEQYWFCFRAVIRELEFLLSSAQKGKQKTEKYCVEDRILDV